MEISFKNRYVVHTNFAFFISRLKWTPEKKDRCLSKN